jgi:hypothetical protein
MCSAHIYFIGVIYMKIPILNINNAKTPSKNCGFAFIDAEDKKFKIKMNDQTFITITNLGDVDVILGQIDAEGRFQPLTFNGIEATNSGDPEAVENYYGWNGVLPVPDNGIKVGEAAEYYKCASVDTSNKTWTGYKVVFDANGYAFEENKTNGLLYRGFTPEVGKVYDSYANALVSKLWSGQIPSDSLLFYAPLAQNKDTAETGQTLQNTGSVIYTEVDNIPCVNVSSGRIDISPYFDTLSNGSSFTISLWVKIISSGDGGLFCLGPGQHGNVNAGFLIHATESSVGFSNAGTRSMNTPDNIDMYTWRHIAAVCTGNRISMFIDGDEKISDSMWELNLDSRLPKIGDTNNIGALDACIAGVRVYERALITDEIKILASEFIPKNVEQ